MSVSEARGLRTQLAGVEAVRQALFSQTPPRLVLARREDTELDALCEEARSRGVQVEFVSENDLRRMARVRPAPAVLALCGPEPGAASVEELLRREGALWLLAGVTYAGNAGYAIRSAEVSGAAGIFLDEGFGPAERKRALRFSMHAERFFPVRWEAALPVLEAATRLGRKVVAIEDVGTRAPWQVDLRGSPLFVIGGEREGVAPALLECCHEVIRIPMRGFVPAYNLQAAMAMVAGERLRQEG